MPRGVTNNVPSTWIVPPKDATLKQRQQYELESPAAKAIGPIEAMGELAKSLLQGGAEVVSVTHDESRFLPVEQAIQSVAGYVCMMAAALNKPGPPEEPTRDRTGDCCECTGACTATPFNRPSAMNKNYVQTMAYEAWTDEADLFFGYIAQGMDPPPIRQRRGSGGKEFSLAGDCAELQDRMEEAFAGRGVTMDTGSVFSPGCDWETFNLGADCDLLKGQILTKYRLVGIYSGYHEDHGDVCFAKYECDRIRESYSVQVDEDFNEKCVKNEERIGSCGVAYRAIRIVYDLIPTSVLRGLGIP